MRLILFLLLLSTPAFAQQSAEALIAVKVGHGVYLTWQGSQGASSYNLYRSTTSGAGYQKITVLPISSLNLWDLSVSGGVTYYYVATAVGSSGRESVYSNQAAAQVPSP